MGHTTTLIADHKGFSRPRVHGDEYVVDAHIDIAAYTTGGEVIPASELSLATITAVMITGVENGLTKAPAIEIDSAGVYASSSSFQIFVTDLDGTNGQAAGDDDVGMIRVRAYGQIA